MAFVNILGKTARCAPDEWPIFAKELRNNIIKNGLYPTGPVMFQMENSFETAEYTIQVPVNEEVDVEGLEGYSFNRILIFDDGLLLRHSDSEESLEESYKLLRTCAKEFGLKLQEPFYNIHIPVYGDAIIDIYAPVQEEPA